MLHTAINGTNEKEQLRNDKRSTVWCFLIVPLHLVKYALVRLTLRHVPRGAVFFFFQDEDYGWLIVVIK